MTQERDEELGVVGKRVQFDDGTFALINLLRRERSRSFQQLADEAFRDLLAKHGHPVKLKDQLRGSLDAAPSENGKSGERDRGESSRRKPKKRPSAQG